MLLTKVTDALGRQSESYTDEKGRSRETVQHAGDEDVRVKYDYDPVGQVTTVHHPNGTITAYTYDMLGRKLSVKHPDAGEVICTYDPAGNMLTKLTSELRNSISDKGCITYTYDYERLKEVLYPKNLFNRVTYTYGAPGDRHNRAGRLSLVEDASGGEAYYYGRMGEVTKTVRTVMASVADIRTYVYGATYDSWNRVRTMTYPDGEVVTYHYNEAGQVESLTSNKLGRESVIIERTGYDKDGHTVYTKLGNGTETTYNYDDARQRLQEMNLTSSGSDIMRNKYQYDAVDNILGISNNVNPQGLTQQNKAKLGGNHTHSYQYDELNRLIHATGKAKSASYDMAMTFNSMSMPLTKFQTVDSTTTAQSYHNYYKYEDQAHPTAPTQIGHDHYEYDANGNPTLVTNDSLNTTRELYWDEDNRLMVLSDNGKTSRYTYNHAGERVVKSHGDMEGVYINGAPQGITFHETDEYTIYPASILTVSKNRFTKHYFIGDKRVASRIGTGKFNNVYGRNGSYVTAGQQDYAERMNQIESQKEDYYKELGIAPGVPTMKGAYGDPENTGVGYNTIITELGDHSVPEAWAQYAKKNDKEDSAPGAPIQWDDPVSPEEPEAGYGFIADSSSEPEETFYYHSDHLGSTSYITDKDGNITQYDAYLPYGELLVDEHSSSEEMPYKFNGKELDEETGLYYYGARYMQPMASIWYGVDAEFERSVSRGSYVFCNANPVRLVDPDGRWSWPWERASLIEYRGNGVFGLRMENFSNATQSNFNAANNNPQKWNSGEVGISTEVGKISIKNYVHESYTVGRKIPGIDPKDNSVKIGKPTALSTGMEDRRYKDRSIAPIGYSAKTVRGVGAIAILDVTIAAMDTYMTLSSFWDSEALQEQTAALKTSANIVNSHMGLIPQKYKESNDKLGAIVNYVFQGVNTTKEQNITKISQQILKKVGRYDKETKKYRPLIEK